MDSGCGDMTQAIFSSSDGGVNWDYSCAPGASAYQMTCEATLGSPIIFGSDPAVWWDDGLGWAGGSACSTRGLEFHFSSRSKTEENRISTN